MKHEMNVYYLIFLATCIDIVTSNKRIQRPRHVEEFDNHFSGIVILTVIVCLCFLIPFIVFLYRFINDPAFPDIVQRMKERFLSASFGNLSDNNKRFKGQ